MGCDIHCYVEHRIKGNGEMWWSFGGRINPGRNYQMFGLLAGVRVNIKPLVKPRGLPTDVGYSAQEDNQHYISDEPDENNVTLKQAEDWVRRGISQFVNGSSGQPVWVTDPDWHTHSWLNPTEWEQALTTYDATNYPIQIEYVVLLKILKAFEEAGREARIVFWFDN